MGPDRASSHLVHEAFGRELIGGHARNDLLAIAARLDRAQMKTVVAPAFQRPDHWPEGWQPHPDDPPYPDRPNLVGG